MTFPSATSPPSEKPSGVLSTRLATGSLISFRNMHAASRNTSPVTTNVTDLEIEEAIREAWAVLLGGSAASPSARRLAAALLAVTGGTQAHPHWVTPDDLWRDRLAVLADQGAWLASWGPRPGEPGCRVPPALLPESQTRRENAYALWRSTARASTDVDSESKTARKPRTHRRDDAEQTSPARPKTRRRKSPVPDGVQD